MTQFDHRQQRHLAPTGTALHHAGQGEPHDAVTCTDARGVLVMLVATSDPLKRHGVLSSLRRLANRLTMEAQKHSASCFPAFKIFEGSRPRWMLIGEIDRASLALVDALFAAPELEALRAVAAIDAYVLWPPDMPGS